MVLLLRTGIPLNMTVPSFLITLLKSVGWRGEVAQFVQCLFSTHKALGSFPSTK